MSSWLTADEAAERLGVKPATLYAYVSRGVLTRRRAGDGRSQFAAEEIERLARRGRSRRPAHAGPELVIRSAVTMLGDDRQYYRGHDALELARWCELEDVAGLLWTDTLERTAPLQTAPLSTAPQQTAPLQTAPLSTAPLRTAPLRTAPWPTAAWEASAHAVAAARTAQAGLPADVLPLERLQVVTPVLAAHDPLRLTADEQAVVHIGQCLVAGLVDSLPSQHRAAARSSAGSPGHLPVSARLWPKLTAQPPDPALRDVLRTALVLLADHELAASTVAARMAASVRADPYAVVLAGLGTTSGALHGGASLGAEALLAEIDDPGQVTHVLGQRLRRGERIPGFGHKVYRAGDGRATALLDALRAVAPQHPKLAVADAVIVEAGRRLGLAVNVDFALALLTNVAGMVPGAGEAIFATARTVGWLAHAIEEYAEPTQLRLRAAYTGPPIG